MKGLEKTQLPLIKSFIMNVSWEKSKVFFFLIKVIVIFQEKLRQDIGLSGVFFGKQNYFCDTQMEYLHSVSVCWCWFAPSLLVLKPLILSRMWSLVIQLFCIQASLYYKWKCSFLEGVFSPFHLPKGNIDMMAKLRQPFWTMRWDSHIGNGWAARNQQLCTARV